MPTIDLADPGGRFLTIPEREEIAIQNAQHLGVREIARRLDRDPATISRELRRNAATRGGKLEFRASVAQRKAELMARRAKPAKFVTNPRLHDYVQERLDGRVHRPDGTIVTGPEVKAWKGRKKPHRQNRRGDLPIPVHRGPGALKRELVACLRTGRALRVPRARSRNKPQGHVTECVRTTIFHEGPYKTVADVEFATAGWVDWYTHRRLHGSLGMLSPNEYEATYYAALTREPLPA